MKIKPKEKAHQEIAKLQKELQEVTVEETFPALGPGGGEATKFDSPAPHI